MIVMCSAYTGFSMMPEDLEDLKKGSCVYWCRSCKKTFMKAGATQCPHCGSKDIKLRVT